MLPLKISLEDIPESLQMTFEHERGKSGIYIVWSMSEEKGYIGMSVNIMDRWILHYQSLVEGTHNAAMVTKVVDDHGIEDLKWAVLEYCKQDHSLLLASEHKWKMKYLGSLLNNEHDRGTTKPPKKVKRDTSVWVHNGYVWSYVNEHGERVYNQNRRPPNM